MADINLSPYSAEYADIQRRQRMADMLAQQSQQPLETNQTAGGYVVPVSPLAGLAKMLQGYTAGKVQSRNESDMRALGEKYRADTMGDMTALARALTAPAMEGRNGYSEFAPATADFQDNPNLATNAAGNVPAVAPIQARAAGELSADGVASMKTPEGQQAYLAQLLAQIAPKDGVVLPEGASLVSKTGKLLLQGTPKDEWGTTPHMEINPLTGQTHAILYSKRGEKRDLGPATAQNQFTSPTVDSSNNLKQRQYEWGSISPYQAISLGIDTARLANQGIDTNFNTGQGVSRPIMSGIPQNAPMPSFGQPGFAPIQSQAQQVAPMSAQAQQVAPVAPAPVAARPAAPAAAPQAVPPAQQPGVVTPKARAEMAADTERQAQGARKILAQIKFDDKGDDDVSKMIRESTSGVVQNWNSGLWGGATGSATSGKVAIQKLAAFANQMTMDLMGGKLGSGISNADRDFVVGQLADVANPNVPANAREAAWKSVVERLKSRATLNQSAPAAPNVMGSGIDALINKYAPKGR